MIYEAMRPHDIEGVASKDIQIHLQSVLEITVEFPILNGDLGDSVEIKSGNFLRL